LISAENVLRYHRTLNINQDPTMPTTRELANAIRILSIDAIQKANSGHPGMPLGMADIATVLWQDFLHHDPQNPTWLNRDRFIISNGHGSMLLYSLLHLTGYDLSIDDIKQFRQLHSKTPGHPEKGCAPGVETTTGPLGQGLANAVGMALAEKVLAAQFNKPGMEIVDHYTYVFAGDGCLMEGISHEACSLAGTWGLGKLIAFWDDNGISIDGHTVGWFTDDTAKRFEAYGWHVIRDVNAYSTDALKAAVSEARNIKDKPSLICCKTIIGFGSPNMCGTHDCHGSPLGDAEIAATRTNLEWTNPPFIIPNEIYKAWDARPKGKQYSAEWQQLFNTYQQQYPDLAAEFLRRTARELPTNWTETTKAYIAKITTTPQAIATRKASQNSLDAYGPILPELLGGSADLTASNLTNWKGSKDIKKADASGNYIHYGVREFGMCGIMNGIILHAGFIPYGGTFLVFSDYARNAIRLAAMMKQQVIYVLSHDSIGLGEDGPTHQPIEQLSSLRLIPHLSVWRPCDETETAVAWQCAIERKNGPTCLALTRQKVKPQPRNATALQNIARGGYVLWESAGISATSPPQSIIIATGSEVELAVAAAQKLNAQSVKIRVVSIPSTDVFDAQPQEYKDSVLPTNVAARLAIEAGVTTLWHKYVGPKGKILGIDHFGESAPDKVLFNDMGFTEENVIRQINAMLL
jgi:transketolase